MPLALLNSFANRNLDTITNVSSSLVENTTLQDGGLRVICAWPLSGQYGPGSRVLYYVLVAACVFARKEDWLRGACLAGALIIPAVAALHGISLAILHVDDAVDMDIYGAFQACCIGILAAPITVKLSKTYFNDPGRNTIFLWTLLILAGLLSLTVEFYRVSPKECDLDLHNFPYEEGSMCNLVCSIAEGPRSHMRKEAVENIYVIPAPDRLTPGTATLIAAGCCIPAILLLVSMWNTILETNWQSRFGRREEDLDLVIEGTNAATLRKMRLVNKRIGSFLHLVEALLFGGGVLAILILGEINFFRPQMRHQTEPMESIGQWGPLVGAGLAALGSLYILMINTDPIAINEKPSSVHHCDCAHRMHGPWQSPRDSADAQSIDRPVFESPLEDPVPFPPLVHMTSPQMVDDVRRKATYPTLPHPRPRHRDTDGHKPSFSLDRGRSPGPSPTSDNQPEATDAGGRMKIARMMTKLGEKLGTAEKETYDDSEFKAGEAAGYPQLPGEQYRNPKLQQTTELYQHTRDLEETERRSRSRAPSFVGSIVSGIDGEPGEGSPRMRSVSPSPSVSRPRRSHTAGQERPLYRSPSSPIASSSSGVPERRATLEVPGSPPVYRGPRHNSSPAAGPLFITVPEVDTGQDSPISPPAIVVSTDADVAVTDSPVGSPISTIPEVPPSKERTP